MKFVVVTQKTVRVKKYLYISHCTLMFDVSVSKILPHASVKENIKVVLNLEAIK